MIIGMVGSRRRNSLVDFQKAKLQFFRLYTPGDTLVSGGCPTGGDAFLERIAIELRLNSYNLKEGDFPRVGMMNVHPALWDKYGKRAGFIRNSYIARDATVLIALVSKDRTGGTEDTIQKYLALGKYDLYLV